MISWLISMICRLAYQSISWLISHLSACLSDGWLIMADQWSVGQLISHLSAGWSSGRRDQTHMIWALRFKHINKKQMHGVIYILQCMLNICIYILIDWKMLIDWNWLQQICWKSVSTAMSCKSAEVISKVFCSGSKLRLFPYKLDPNSHRHLCNYQSF